MFDLIAVLSLLLLPISFIVFIVKLIRKKLTYKKWGVVSFVLLLIVGIWLSIPSTESTEPTTSSNIEQVDSSVSVSSSSTLDNELTESTNTESTSMESTSKPSEDSTVESESVQSEEETPTDEEVLVDDDVIKVTFIEIFEEEYIEGICYLKLKVENKSDKTIMVMPKDSYVNDTSVVIGSGVHMELAAGKNSQNPFLFSYNNLDITGKDEIEKIEFKLWIVDEDMETIEETENLVINLE